VPNILVDGSLILVPGGTVVSSNTTYPAIAVPLYEVPACAWIIAVSAVNNGPEYVFSLEWSSTQGGVYALAAVFTLPTVIAPTNFAVGVGGGMFQRNDARWLRLRVTIGGGGRSVTFGSGFTRLTGMPGLGMQPNAVVVAP
jgi:hypothetical protein